MASHGGLTRKNLVSFGLHAKERECSLHFERDTSSGRCRQHHKTTVCATWRDGDRCSAPPALSPHHTILKLPVSATWDPATPSQKRNRRQRKLALSRRTKAIPCPVAFHEICNRYDASLTHPLVTLPSHKQHGTYGNDSSVEMTNSHHLMLCCTGLERGAPNAGFH